MSPIPVLSLLVFLALAHTAVPAAAGQQFDLAVSHSGLLAKRGLCLHNAAAAAPFLTRRRAVLAMPAGS